MIIQTKEDVVRTIDFLERCAILMLEASELRNRQLDNEHRPDAKRTLQAQIGILRARIGLVLSHVDALEDLGLGARLTGPSPEVIKKVEELSAQVALETNNAKRAELVLGIVNDVITLAAEVRELTTA